MKAGLNYMNAMLDSLEDGCPSTPGTFGMGIETCDTVKGLAAINNSDTELVILQRALPLRLQSWLAQMDGFALPNIRVLIEPAELRAALDPHFDDCMMPSGEMRDLFLEDIDELVSTFAKITQHYLVDVRLERITHDACWKFHRDCVEARLLTTYRGSTTEWVQPLYADQALRDQKSFEGPLERLQTHDVAIFKGSCANPGSGIVHRSPPIAGSGETRLLLVLNKPSASSPDRWNPDLQPLPPTLPSFL